MEYSIQELSHLAGVTTRTLRWYDKIDLLKPSRTTESGYRYYGPAEVDRLQDILFYRALGVDLAQIKECLDTPSFDRLAALHSHLAALEAEQQRIQELIRSVKDTIDAEERNETMSDEKKFEALKRNAVEQYEKCYEQEARTLYGNEEVEHSKKDIMGMTMEKYQQWTELDSEILHRLEQAIRTKLAPDTKEGKEIVELHRRWLMIGGTQYNVAMHKSLACLYVTDNRFSQYYDKNVSGCAEFLRDAILHWADK